MSRTKSSRRWLSTHFSDPFVRKAQAEGYRSRAVYKLQEIDAKENLIKPGLTIIELGASPGGWAQYIIKKLQGKGKLFALDLLVMEPLDEVCFIQGDFSEENVSQKLVEYLPSPRVDLILSDMAPNWTGSPSVDIPRAIQLSELVLDFAEHHLKMDGNLLLKCFQGEGFEDLLNNARQLFTKVSIKKPKASRSQSREIYLLAKGLNLV